MYGICNFGFKKDDLNIYFSAYDSFSCFFTDSPVSVHVCMYCSDRRVLIVSLYLDTYIHVIRPKYTLHVPTRTFYSAHTYILFDPYIHYTYIIYTHTYILFGPHGILFNPHGTLINIRIHLRKYE